jgi:hypothetical protein
MQQAGDQLVCSVAHDSHAEPMSRPEDDLSGFLLAHQLAKPDEPACWRPLTGGVSSDIWVVELLGRSLCLKRALPKLKVAGDWHAPLSRNAYEWAWIKFAAQYCPDTVPSESRSFVPTRASPMSSRAGAGEFGHDQGLLILAIWFPSLSGVSSHLITGSPATQMHIASP